jgi:hypothetical protein
MGKQRATTTRPVKSIWQQIIEAKLKGEHPSRIQKLQQKTDEAQRA